MAIEVAGSKEIGVGVHAARIGVPANGLAGGGKGGMGAVRLNDVSMDAKGRILVQPGDVIELETPGGGGYGVADGVKSGVKR